MSQGGHIVGHIVVVDDEAAAREMVGDYLKMHGFAVTLCDGGRELRAALKRGKPDLVVLDLNMPEEDGLSLVRHLRQQGQLPIIVLTATASPIDRIVGLELGADDYLAKPVELRELLARIRSVLRRADGSPATAASGKGVIRGVIKVGTRWLDLEQRSLRDESGADRALTASEFNLLKAFVENPRKVLTRERLLDLANARDPDAFDRAIDVRVTRIRKKIEPDPNNPRIIRTVRGAGYMFVPDQDD